MTTHPNTITACGVELHRVDVSSSDAIWSAAIGAMRIELRTRDGHWWSRVKPPAWILIPERVAGPLPQDDAIAALEREVAVCLRAMRVAEMNLDRAKDWFMAGGYLEAL